MNFDGASLADVAAALCAVLESRGIEGVIVGGSAITVYVPDVYRSYDVDFAVPSAASLSEIDDALASIGFFKHGRNYTNTTTEITLDYVAVTPQIDDRYITDYEQVMTPRGAVRVLHFEDALADRVAHYIYWGDRQALIVASQALASRADASLDRLSKALDALNAPTEEIRDRLDRARKRLLRA